MCDPVGAVVADLGAGTGISARALAALGARVFAVEPNAAMRGQAAADSRVVWIDAQADATTLDDGSVDLATALQAWHWFDSAAAFRDARRIVRPGGRIAVVYNERDESDATTAEFGAIVRRFALDRTEARRAAALTDFGDGASTVRKSFRADHRLSRDSYADRVASTSYLPHEGEAGDALRAEMDTFFDARAHRGILSLHLITTVAYVPVR